MQYINPDHSAQKQTKPATKFSIGKILVLCLLAVAALLLTARLLIATPVGRHFIESQLENRELAGQIINIDGLKGDVLGKFSFDRITINDKDGEWLDAEDGKITWSPLRIFGKTLKISSSDIASISIHRKPLLAQSPKDEKMPEGSEKKTIIKRIIVENSDIQSIIIKKETGLLETEHSVHLQADIGGSDSSLKIKTISTGHTNQSPNEWFGKETTEIDLNWSLAKLLNGSVDVHIPQNGFIASFLPDALEDDLQLSFEGSGDIENWQSNGKILLGSTNILSLTGQSINSSAKLNIISDFENFKLAAPLTDRLGTTLSFDIGANLSARRNAPIQLALTSRSLTAETAGLADLETFKMLDQWDISADALSLSSLSGQNDLDADDANFKGQWQATPQGITLEGELKAQGLIYQSFSAAKLLAGLKASLLNDNFEFNVSTIVDTPQTGIELLQSLAGPQVSADVEGTFVLANSELDVDKLKITTSEFSLSSTDIQIAPNSTSLKLLAELSDIKKLTKLAQGPLRANIKVTNLGKDNPTKIQINSLENKLISDDPYISNLLASTTNIEALVSISPSQLINLNGIASSGANSIRLHGSLYEEQLDADIVAQLPSYNSASLVAENVNLGIDITGPLSALNLKTDIKVQTLKAPNLNIDSAVLLSNGSIANGILNNKLNITANANQHPLNLAAIISSEEGLHLSDLTAQWADLALTADMHMTSNNSPNAQLHLFGPIDALGYAGSVDLRGSLENDKIDISGLAENLSIADLNLTKTSIDADGDINDLKFDLATTGTAKIIDAATPLAITVNGQYLKSETTQNIQFMLGGNLDEEEFASKGPIKITHSSSNTDANAVLKMLGGEIEFTGGNAQSSKSFSATLSNIALGRVGNILGRENLEGKLSGTANWTGQNNQAIGEYTLTLNDVGRSGDEISHIDATAVGTYIEERLVSIIEAHNGPDLNMDAVFSIPLIIKNGLPNLNHKDVARLDVGALGKLEAAWSIIGLDSLDLNGFVELNAEAEAPLLELRPVGNLDISNARFEHDRYGARMENIDAQASFDVEGIHVHSARANGLDGGTVEGSGDFFWSPEKTSALNVDFKNFGAIKRDGLDANFTGRLDIARTQNGIGITGDLNVDQAKVNIAQFGSSGVKTVNVVFLEDLDKNQNAKPQISPTSRMELDLDISADKRVFVTGRGVNLELSADTQVKGTLKKPDVRGSADIVRGNFSLLGQPFEFTKGVVRLDGDPTAATTEMKADRTSDGVTSSILVSGLVSAPEISFSSSPELPEDEIISRLLFGRAPSQLSAVEAAQLAVAAASMTGNGEGFAPLSSIQNAIGLDKFVISQDADNNPQLESGKYLSDNVYVELRSRSGGQSDLAVEWEPVENVEIGTVFGNETGARVSVQWKKELD